MPVKQRDFTVGIPFFNAESTLHYAIESVLRQELSNFELLLVNDGSTDGSVGIAERYLYDPRVTLLGDEQRMGLAPRLNQITDSAGCDFIARMDADDIMLPSRLIHQVEVLRTRPDIDLVGTGVYLMGRHGRILGKRSTPTVRLCRRFSYLQLFHPTVSGRREWFLRNRYSDRFLRCEDTELWIRSGGGGNLMTLPEPGLIFNRYGTFDANKTCTSLRQFQQILHLHRHRTCVFCRTKHIWACRFKRLLYSMYSLSRLNLDRVDWKTQKLDEWEQSRVEALVSDIRTAADNRWTQVPDGKRKQVLKDCE